jgi:hypothetical protein
MWTRPIQLCWRWQTEMFKATEPFATGWFERQLDATRVALENIEKLTQCGLAEAGFIQRQWFKATAERLMAELEKLMATVTSSSREAVLASRDTIESVAEAATPDRPAAQVKPAGQKKAGKAKTKVVSEAKTESTGEAKVETADEAKTEPAGEVIEAVVEAKVGQAETQTASEASVEAAA